MNDGSQGPIVMGPGAAKKDPAGFARYEAARARNRKPQRLAYRKVWCRHEGCTGHEDHVINGIVVEGARCAP